MLGFGPISNQPISDIALPQITGTISATDNNDSATLTGQVLVTGNISATDGTDTCTIYAQELVSGYIYTTDNNDSATLTGAVAVTGTISATDGTDTATFTAQNLVSAYISATDGTDTATFTAQALESGNIYATDGTDTCDIEGFVTPGPNPNPIDTHDGGISKRDYERLRALERKRLAAEQRLIEARKADAASRKQKFRDLIDPVVSKQQKNKLQSKQEIRIDTPSVEVTRIEAVIANLDRQEKELQQAIAHKKVLAETLTALAILDAKFKAEQDDEEALLMLL
jgi:hypothetical protein